MNKKILNLTIPNIISNITVPLLGMADLAIAGRLGDFHYIGAIGIGVAIFNLIYWNFGFLRMGTSGFAAQAYGARDFKEVANVFARGLIVALGVALLILLLQVPLSKIALYILNGEGRSGDLALQYFKIRVWAAPATLSLYVCNGWYIGVQNSKTPMMIAIIMNIVNISCSVLCAIVFDLGVAGIALGTVISQYVGLILSASIIFIRYKKIISRINYSEILAIDKLKNFFAVNRDIFLRTICLAAVFTFFTSASSSMGGDVLAVNTLLLQLFTLFSYFMDGFAHAGEALVGRYVGSGNEMLLKKAIRYLIGWGVAMSIPFTIAYALFLVPLLSLFTNDSAVLEASLQFRWWITAVPLVSFLAFLYDGVLVGATESALMRNAMFVATSLFFISYYALNPIMQNSALWLSLIIYLLLRGVVQAYMFKRVKMFG